MSATYLDTRAATKAYSEFTTQPNKSLPAIYTGKRNNNSKLAPLSLDNNL